MRATSCSVWISEAVVMASVKARVTFFSSFRGVLFFFYEAICCGTFFEQCLQPDGYLACEGNLSGWLILPRHSVFNKASVYLDMHCQRSCHHACSWRKEYSMCVLK